MSDWKLIDGEWNHINGEWMIEKSQNKAILYKRPTVFRYPASPPSFGHWRFHSEFDTVKQASQFVKQTIKNCLAEAEKERQAIKDQDNEIHAGISEIL